MKPITSAFQLLKGGVRGIGSAATDNIYHYPHELDYGSMSNFMTANPNATLGDMVSPYLQGQFTNNPQTNPPAYQSERDTQLQSTVPAPFPQTLEQTQGVQQLIDEGFDDYESRDRTRKPHYDSMNNAVRVLSRNLRANPVFDFAPPGRIRGTKGGRGRSREVQNMKLRSLLDTPVSQTMAEMVAPKQGIPITASEPMEIAFQLLKGIDEYDNSRVDDERIGREAIFNPQKHPGDMNRHGGSEGFSQAYGYGYLPNMVERDGGFKERHPDFDQWVENEDKRTGYEGFDEGILAHFLPYIASANSEEEFLQRLKEADEFDKYDAPYPFEEAQQDLWNKTAIGRTDEHTFYGLPYNEETGFTRSEPMDIAFQLLKERKSPEAMRRKLEYDKRYEKTPERRKYQRDLHAERRKRGIYGSGDHMDVSHTQGGKLTLEGEHSNRARHFKNRGTLRRVSD